MNHLPMNYIHYWIGCGYFNICQLVYKNIVKVLLYLSHGKFSISIDLSNNDGRDWKGQ